jgi:hypothetical protein
MKRTLWMGMASLLCAGVMVSLGSARAMMIAPQPIAQRVANAEVIMVGKVTGFGDRTVSASPAPGAKNKVEYQIALVKVESTIAGAKGTKEIKVGFIPPMAGGAAPGGPIRPGLRRPMGVNFTLDQEGLMFLTKHHEGDFYVAPMYFSVINKAGNTNFAKEVEETKRCVKLLADPKAGLDSKEMADRLLTAGMLMNKFRQFKPGKAEKKPIDPELSKKILLTLAEADWNARPARPGPFQMNPQMIFGQLQLTADDGWKPPKDFKQFPAKAKEWCKDNADKYIIKRNVYENDEKKEKKGDK